MRRHSENTCQVTAIVVATLATVLVACVAAVAYQGIGAALRGQELLATLVAVVLLFGPGFFWLWLYDKIYRRMRRDEG